MRVYGHRVSTPNNCGSPTELLTPSLPRPGRESALATAFLAAASLTTAYVLHGEVLALRPDASVPLSGFWVLTCCLLLLRLQSAARETTPGRGSSSRARQGF
eukprot:Polyplicarium_translucidae@DN3309_c0_g3_i3.p3